MILRKLIFAAAFAVGFAGASHAQESFDVVMLNQSTDEEHLMVYEPDVLRISSGDTVNWLSTDPGHNAEFARGGTPEGAGRFRSRPSRDESFTFEIPGVYVIQCTPHMASGMVMLVVVDDDLSNIEQAKKVRFRGKARERLDEQFARLEAEMAAEAATQ